tara:strand:+ start:10830 stop:11180 length:351 start_codon:yes stop_codon:yes gene_type:complete
MNDLRLKINPGENALSFHHSCKFSPGVSFWRNYNETLQHEKVQNNKGSMKKMKCGVKLTKRQMASLRSEFPNIGQRIAIKEAFGLPISRGEKSWFTRQVNIKDGSSNSEHHVRNRP